MSKRAGERPATPAPGDGRSWRPPTRRAFVAMLGAAAAAFVVREAPRQVPEADPPRSPWTGKTRWIGHC